MNTNAPSITKFDPPTYRAALAYCNLPKNYTRTFQLVLTDEIDEKTGKPKTWFKSCNVAVESKRGNATWVQVNQPRQGSALTKNRYPKKASNEEIEYIANITLDAEFPPDPYKAHRIGLALIAGLIEQGLAEPGAAVEDSGAGFHIVLPIPTIQTIPETAKQWNDAVRAVVKKYVQPEFDRLVQQEGIEMDLCGFDISRVLSFPGTWRPTNPEKPDCEALKQGYLRRWLAPYTDGHYPIRKECAKLAELLRAEFEQLNPAQWLSTYASQHPNSDRSGLFQSLVNAVYLKYDEWIAKSLKEDINFLSGEKYNGRLDEEFQRALEKAKLLSKNNKPKASNRNESSSIATLLCSFDEDDAGNADAMNALYGEEFLYCPSLGWLHYNGTYYTLDLDGTEVKRCAIETLRQRRHAAVDAKQEAIIKCTKADERRVNACVNLFKTHVSANIESFDSDPDKLNCQNGVLDLRTGTLEEHYRSQRFTYCLPVPYEPSDYTEWLDYLKGVVGGGDEVINYLQKALGYSLTGYTREEILFYLFGPTRSGKGTLAETFMALLPHPLSAMVDFNSFTAKREGDVSNFDLAPLKPSRLLFASESNRSQSLNPAKVKQLTGGDHIRACFKHKDFFDYRPQFKVWMMSNHPLNGDPEDDALWGRVRVIEFPNSFLGREDKSKKERLKTPEVLKGVLYWAVQGAIKWYALGPSGLTTPNAIEETTQAQRDELDYVQQWLKERCEDDGLNFEPNEKVNASYTAWCEDNHIQFPKSPKGLAQSLKAHGYVVGEVKLIEGKSKRGVRGLRIK